MKESIRVAMIIQDYLPLGGGAERQLAALAPLLKEQQVEIHILTRRYSGLLPYELVDGVPVHRLPIIKPRSFLASLMFTLTAQPLLKRLQPDLVHAHGLLSPATVAVAAKRRLGTPVVAKVLRGGSFGDLDRLKRKPFGRRRIRLFRQQIDAFVTISQEIDEELSTVGVSPEQRFFIPNGVDLKRFYPVSLPEKQALRTALGLPGGPIVIYTGRLETEKRIDQLVKIWPSIRITQPDARLLILGTGTEEARLKQMAGDGVLFLGRVDNVADYLQTSDIFVLPSATEGLSNALLEAMASGLPAIATAVGGAPDLIDHCHNGWLISPDKPAELQEALLTLLNDAAFRNNFGRQGHRKVVENYALPATARQLRALYDQLIIN